MANTANQFLAIQNGSKANSLVSQLYAGQPQVQAAASTVKNPNTPTNNSFLSSYVPSSNTPNMSTNAGPKPAVNMSVAPPPVNQPVKKQTVTDTNGNSHITEYHVDKANPDTTVGATLNTDPAGGGGHAIIPSGGLTGQARVDNTQPITGNATTPSGAVVNATTGQIVSTPTQTTGGGTTNAGIISNLSGFNPFSNPAVSGAYTKAQDLQTQLDKSRQEEAGALTQNRLNPIPIGDQTGREAVIQNQYLQKQNALAQEEAGQASIYQGGFTGTGQQESALSQAGTLSTPSNQFAQVPYSNQIIGADGKPINGSATGTLPQGAQDFVSSLAQQVKNGQMTRADAEARLSTYGQPGIQALNTALGPDFNTNASNASGATTATGQQLQTQATAANQALDTLTQQFNKLGSLTGATGFQPANAIEQSIANLFGNDAVSQYTTTLQEARAKISGVLAASGGVTPTTADEMAKTYLPDGMTPSQLPAKIAAAKALIQQSVDAFTKSGQQNNSNGSITWDNI